MTLMTGAMAAMFLLRTLYMGTVMEYSPLSVGIAYLLFCAVLVAALAASAPLVTRHGHRPAACTAFTLAAAGLTAGVIARVQQLGAALVLLMTDHTRRRPASFERSHAARILPRFGATPRR